MVGIVLHFVDSLRERILISLSSQHLFSAITEQCSCTDVKKLKLSSRLFWPKFDNLAC